jgi:pantothenate kinase
MRDVKCSACLSRSPLWPGHGMRLRDGRAGVQPAPSNKSALSTTPRLLERRNQSATARQQGQGVAMDGALGSRRVLHTPAHAWQQKGQHPDGLT